MVPGPGAYNPTAKNASNSVSMPGWGYVSLIEIQ